MREVLRQIAESLFVKLASKDQYATRAASALAAGLLICTVSLLVLYLVWPSAELFGSFAEIGGWRGLIGVALANSIVLISAYLAVAALIWGAADATMAQPRDLAAFDRAAGQCPAVASLCICRTSTSSASATASASRADAARAAMKD